MTNSLQNDTFLRACRREPVQYTPVWFMRQAGRYMPEYRALRANHSFMEMTKTPELAAQITLQPVQAFPLDAAIIYSDILLPLEPMGVALEFAAGEGPVIHNPVRTPADVDALRVVEPAEELAFVGEAIRLVKRSLPDLPLIGFAGAPFTLASYVIEGGSSKNYVETKRVMFSAPDAWHSLMAKLAEVVARHLRGQVAAGADAVQLFDSWVGCLNPADYREYVLPHTQRIFQSLRDLGVPAIHFGTNTATLLPLMREAGGDVIGIDWRIDLGDAWARLDNSVAIQGNLDPVAFFAPPQELERRVAAVLEQAAARPGHIFNVGHGILPGTPVENVRLAVDLVHRLSTRANVPQSTATHTA
ncbi:MAG: uroporphyrinogen decarboxylase [Anaerolineae bacterium]